LETENIKINQKTRGYVNDSFTTQQNKNKQKKTVELSKELPG